MADILELRKGVTLGGLKIKDLIHTNTEMAFVIDAAATLPWCFEDEATPSTDRLLFDLRMGDMAAVPAHWPLEVLNSLLAVRRGRIPRGSRV